MSNWFYSNTLLLAFVSCGFVYFILFCLMMKKLPKKYPVFFVGLFTFKAENLVCKNVDIMGNVIFVQKSIERILGIAVRASIQR